MTATTERLLTGSSSLRGKSSPTERRQPSSADAAVRTAVDLITTYSQTHVRLNTTTANCLRPDSPNFLEHPTAATDSREVRGLIAWCNECPIQSECLADALVWENGAPSNRTQYVRGGMTGRSRRALIDRLRSEGVLDGWH
ncbi:MAG: WhiB family transcriptional regulator [Nocardioidaceae bacterium]